MQNSKVIAVAAVVINEYKLSVNIYVIQYVYCKDQVTENVSFGTSASKLDEVLNILLKVTITDCS